MKTKVQQKMLIVSSVGGTGALSSPDLSDTSTTPRLLTPLPTGDKESFPFVKGMVKEHLLEQSQQLAVSLVQGSRTW